MKNDELKIVVIHQLEGLFLLSDEEKNDLDHMIERAENDAITSLDGFPPKRYTHFVDPYHTVMYCTFLYWLSHECYKNGYERLASKVYALNKALHSVDLFYAISLPKIWSCEHPLGAVMGRASYGERFFFYQGCSVGGNRHNGQLDYPVLGNDLIMYSDSKILGKCVIGNNVVLSANAYVINTNVPDNTIVFGQSPNLLLKRR